MDIDKYFSTCKDNFDSFKEKVLPLEYPCPKAEETGISLLEGFSFCMASKYFELDMVIESGTAWGMSTSIFARFLDIPIKTVDTSTYYGKEVHDGTIDRLSKYNNVECIVGDSYKVIPDIISKNRSLKIGLFIDGPKGMTAIDIAKKNFVNKNVLFAGIHDTCRKERYHLMDFWGNTFLYSDDDRFSPYHELCEKCNNGGVGFAENK